MASAAQAQRDGAGVFAEPRPRPGLSPARTAGRPPPAAPAPATPTDGLAATLTRCVAGRSARGSPFDVGVRPTALSGPCLQRVFAGDLQGAMVLAAVARLKRMYPSSSDAFTIGTVARFVSTPEPYDAAAVARELGVTEPPQPVSAGVTPSTVRSSIGPPQPARPLARPSPVAVASGTSSPTLAPPVRLATPSFTVSVGSPTPSVGSPTLSVGSPTPSVGEATGSSSVKLPSGPPRTTFDLEALRTVIDGVFATKRAPAREDFLSALKSHYDPTVIDDIVGSSAFVYGFQALVRAHVRDGASEFLTNTAISDVGTPADALDMSSYRMHDIRRWTLRHYSDAGTDDTPPPFREIKSGIQLGLMASAHTSSSVDAAAVKKKKSGHTGDRDWNKYGNTGSTFFLLYLDGEPVEKQKFLSNTKWYAEVPFDQPSLWISSDWLDEKGIKGPALRGSGKSVQRHLLKLGGRTEGTTFRQLLMSHFHNLEVKIPGSVTVPAWIKAT